MLVIMRTKTGQAVFSQEKKVPLVFKEVLDWLDTNWHCAAAVAGVFYMLMLPFRGKYTSVLLLLVLQMPFYIVHQLEEHVHDRFRLDINWSIGGGLDVLPHRAVAVINILGVWGVEWLALYLAIFVHPGFAMLAFFLAIVNGLTHTASALVRRAYNPGLLTSLLLLMPGGAAGIYFFVQTQRLRSFAAVLSLVFILVEHLWIVAYVLRRKRRLTLATNMS